MPAMILVHHDDADLRRGVAASAEDHGKDGKKRHRQDEAQRQGAAVAPQGNQGGAYDGEDQSRSSLPVNCRNTDSRLGFRNDTSASSCPALAAASSNPAISVACSMVNCAVPSSKRPSALFHPGHDALVGVFESRQHLAARRESVVHQFILGPQGDDASVIDDGDSIAQPLGLFHVVRGVNDGHSLSRSFSIISKMRLRDCGSTPTVGSSIRTSLGRWMSPAAMFSRRFMPPEKLAPCLRRDRRARPTPGTMRLRFSERAAQTVVLAEGFQVFAAG